MSSSDPRRSSRRAPELVGDLERVARRRPLVEHRIAMRATPGLPRIVGRVPGVDVQRERTIGTAAAAREQDLQPVGQRGPLERRERRVGRRRPGSVMRSTPVATASYWGNGRPRARRRRRSATAARRAESSAVALAIRRGWSCTPRVAAGAPAARQHVRLAAEAADALDAADEAARCVFTRSSSSASGLREERRDLLVDRARPP